MSVRLRQSWMRKKRRRTRLKNKFIDTSPTLDIKGEDGRDNSDNPVMRKANIISEVVTSYITRRNRSRIAKRRRFALARSRKLARKRFATPEVLEKRARRRAIYRFKNRNDGRYRKASPGSRISIDKLLHRGSTQGVVTKMANRLKPTTRRDEVRRRRRKINESLEKKSIKYNIPYEIIEEVFIRGLLDHKCINKAFDRVNSFISGGKSAKEMDDDLIIMEDNKKTFKRLQNILNDPIKREIGTTTLTDLYKSQTPGQIVNNLHKRMQVQRKIIDESEAWTADRHVEVEFRPNARDGSRRIIRRKQHGRISILAKRNRQSKKSMPLNPIDSYSSNVQKYNKIFKKGSLDA